MARGKDSTSNEDVSILSAGVKLEGKLYSEGNVRVDGHVLGSLAVNGNLTLGEASDINGDVKARNITINGKLEGRIEASEKLILERNSKIKADIVSKILVVEEGASFDGKSVMNGNAGTEG